MQGVLSVLLDGKAGEEIEEFNTLGISPLNLFVFPLSSIFDFYTPPDLQLRSILNTNPIPNFLSVLNILVVSLTLSQNAFPRNPTASSPTNGAPNHRTSQRRTTSSSPVLNLQTAAHRLQNLPLTYKTASIRANDS